MKHPKRPRDMNQLGKMIVDEATGNAPPPPEAIPRSPESEAAAILGRKGGSKGGKARAAKLTEQERKDIAKKGSQARWHKPNAGG